jgi:hypothetical protein
MYIYSLHVYSMITSNHDSGTCTSIAFTFIPWLLPIMIQVYVYIAFTFIPWLLVIMIQVHVCLLFARLYHDYFQSWFRYMYIYSLHLYTMITSNHDSGTSLSIAYTFIQWLLPIMIQVYVYIAFTFMPWLLVIMIQVHVYILFARLYHEYFQSWFRYMYIYSLHVYTMITSNHDSGTCISIACKFIPWLLLIKIQVHVHL